MHSPRKLRHEVLFNRWASSRWSALLQGFQGTLGQLRWAYHTKLDKTYLWLENINSLIIKTKSIKLAHIGVFKMGPWVKGSSRFKVTESYKSSPCHSLTCTTLANQTPRSLGSSFLTINEKQNNQFLALL